MRTNRCIALSIFIFIGWLVLPIQPAAAWTQVTLAWSPNMEPDLAGYRVFSRLEEAVYAYDAPAWEGDETTCSLDIPEEDSPHCFVVRAFDTEGYESADSNEVCYNGIPSSIKASAAYSSNNDALENESDSSGGCFIHALSEP